MNEYMPHGFCLQFNLALMGLHVLSDLLIAFSYFAIPIMLVVCRRLIPALIPRWAAYLFAAFILLCGIGHVLDVIVLWRPMYWLQGYEKALTAVVSFYTAGMLGHALRGVILTSQPAVRLGGPETLPDAFRLPEKPMPPI